VNDTQLFGIPHLLTRGNTFLEAIVLYCPNMTLICSCRAWRILTMVGMLLLGRTL
jgi:hypothetical protein